MVHDDVVGQRQPQARALVRRLGGEEGVEDIGKDLLRDARAIVTQNDDQLLALAAGGDTQLRLVGLALGFHFLALLVRGVAGVVHHVEENPPQVVRDDVQLAGLGVQVLLDVQLELVVRGPGGMVGQAHMLGDDRVDLRHLELLRAAPHAEHVLDDAVGTLAVAQDAAEVLLQVVADFLDGLLLGAAELAAFRLLQFLAELAQHLHRALGEVLDEVQRVLDFVRHPGGQLAERRELLLHHNLVLRVAQLLQHPFQPLVLLGEFVGQLLHQVQALGLQGRAPEDLQRRRHLRHFVMAAQLHRALQVAVRHGAHLVGQEVDAPHELPDEAPANEHRAHHRQEVDPQEVVLRVGDGVPGRARRVEGAPLLGLHLPLDHVAQGYGLAAVGSQQVQLLFLAQQRLLLQAEAAAFAGAQAQQLVEGSLQFQRQARGRPGAFQAEAHPLGGGVKALPQGVQLLQVVGVEDADQQLDALVDGEFQLHQAAEALGVGACRRRALSLGALGALPLGGRADRRRLGQLGVQGAAQEALHPLPQGQGLGLLGLYALFQGEGFRHRLLYGADVVHQVGGGDANLLLVQLLAFQFVECGQLGLKAGDILGYVAAHPLEAAQGDGAGEPGAGGCQGVPLLGHQEGSDHVRQAVAGAALDVGNARDGNPCHQACRHGERHSAANAEVEPRGYAVQRAHERLQAGDGQQAARRATQGLNHWRQRPAEGPPKPLDPGAMHPLAQPAQAGPGPPPEPAKPVQAGPPSRPQAVQSRPHQPRKPGAHQSHPLFFSLTRVRQLVSPSRA